MAYIFVLVRMILRYDYVAGITLVGVAKDTLKSESCLNCSLLSF